MRVLLAQPVRADQIQSIFQEVVPKNVEQGFLLDGDATFSCDIAGGPVTVYLRRAQGKLDAIVRSGTQAQFVAAIDAQRAQIAAIHAASLKPKP